MKKPGGCLVVLFCSLLLVAEGVCAGAQEQHSFAIQGSQFGLDGKPLTGWQVFPLPMADLSPVKFHPLTTAERGPAQDEGSQTAAEAAAGADSAGPHFYAGRFRTERVGDTFMDVRGSGYACRPAGADSANAVRPGPSVRARSSLHPFQGSAQSASVAGYLSD